MSRTHSIMRIATTASPVSGAEVCARSKAIAIAVRQVRAGPVVFAGGSPRCHLVSRDVSNTHHDNRQANAKKGLAQLVRKWIAAKTNEVADQGVWGGLG